jgi:hypothetical protein
MKNLYNQASKYLSKHRLKKHLDAAGEDMAVQHYYECKNLCTVAMQQIETFEVILRNIIHSILLSKNQNYLDKSTKILNKSDYQKINETIIYLRRNKTYTVPYDELNNPNERIVSNLTFGFWITLLKNQKLSLFKDIFSKNICKKYYLSTKNKKPHIIDTIHLLRNYVAHHRIGKYTPSEIVKILEDISILNSDIICDNSHKDYYDYVSNKQKVIIDKACLYQNKIDNIKKVEAVNAEA